VPTKLLAVVLSDNNVDVVRALGLATTVFKNVATSALIADVSGSNANNLEGVECIRLIVLDDTCQREHALGTDVTDSLLTSLHHQIAASWEQLTRPQLPGPGPLEGLSGTLLR